MHIPRARFSRARFSRALIIALTLVMTNPPSIFADVEEEEFSGFGSDWSLRLTARKMHDYMTYKGAKLHPVTSVRVVFGRRNERTNKWDAPVRYEDLWFFNGKAVGCRRENALPDLSGKYGTIRIMRSADADMETQSLIGAAIRLMLDVQIKEGVLNDLVIPLDIYDRCATDLANTCFYEAKMGSALDQMVLVHVVSEPRKRDKYFRLRTRTAE